MLCEAAVSQKVQNSILATQVVNNVARTLFQAWAVKDNTAANVSDYGCANVALQQHSG